MNALRWLLVLAAVVVFAPAAATAQEPKDPPKSSAAKAGESQQDPAVVPRGQLPPNWRQLGMTEEQKNKVYAVQGKFRARMADLEKQLKEIKAEERKELEKLLSPEQRRKLKELTLGEKTPVP
jgi:Spy/CpxP family protein refolding chaperone